MDVDDLRDQVEELRRAIADQQARLHEQAHELAALRALAARVAIPSGDVTAVGAGASRRDVLRLAGAGVVGAAGATLLGAPPVAATTGDPLVAGQTEDAETQTTLVYDGPALVTGGVFVAGTGAAPAPAATAGVIGYAAAPAAQWGVHGTSTNASGGGVVGTATGEGVGVAGQSVAGPDLLAAGTGFIRLVSSGHDFPAILAPQAGDLFRLEDGTLFYTTVTGPPAQVVALTGNVGGLVLLDSPARVVDTRQGGGALQPGTVRTFSLQTALGTGADAVPEGSRAAVITVTLDGTEGAGGYLTVYAADQPRPEASTINWFGPAQILANTTVTRVVRGTGEVNIYTGVNRTHVIIDVLGYYR